MWGGGGGGGGGLQYGKRTLVILYLSNVYFLTQIFSPSLSFLPSFLSIANVVLIRRVDNPFSSTFFSRMYFLSCEGLRRAMKSHLSKPLSSLRTPPSVSSRHVCGAPPSPGFAFFVVFVISGLFCGERTNLTPTQSSCYCCNARYVKAHSGADSSSSGSSVFLAVVVQSHLDGFSFRYFKFYACSVQIDSIDNRIRSNLTESDPIRSYLIQHSRIKSNPIQSNPIQCKFILTIIQSSPIQSGAINFNPIQFSAI